MFGSKEVLRQGKNVKENNFLTFGLMWKIWKKNIKYN